MKFPSIIIENFLTIGKATIQLADRGLVLIEGVNNDDSSANSNGSGKSSIADAICWCLYGTTARGESGDAVINEVAGKDCSVVMTIDDDGVIYVVARHRKHKVGKNALQVLNVTTKVDLTQGTDKLTQATLDRILDRSYDVFRAALYAGQDQMPNLPGMTDKQLKMLVEEAAGTTVLELAYDEARNRCAMAKDKKKLADMVLERMVRDRDQAKATALELESDRAAHDIDVAARAITATAQIRTLIDEVNVLKIELAKLDKAKVAAELAAVDAAIASVRAERTEEQARIVKSQNADRATSARKAVLATLKKDYDRQKIAVEEIEKRIGTPCDECGKAYCEHDIEDARVRANAKLREIAKQFREVKAEVEALQVAHKSVADELEAFQASMTDVSAQNTLRGSLDASMRAIASLEARILKQADFARECKKRLDDMKLAPNPFIARIAHYEDVAAKLDVEIVADKAAMVGLDERLAIAESSVKVFGPAGVRAHILDEVTPYLNDQTAKYLGTLSDGNISATWSTLNKTKAGELREKFAIEVSNSKGGSSFGLISGGEKRKVRIAAALALQDLVATRSTKPIDLFIGDEIDDALDPAGLERLMMILEEKAKERGTVLIISHGDLKSWVSQVMTVTKSGRVSTVTEEVI